jgi:hypothetical protein
MLHAFSVIPPRYQRVSIWRTHGKYRKQMKRGYCKVLYNQRNKNETIISVIKRLFGEHVTSRLVRTQNRELSFRCIAYNTHRLTNLTLITWFLQSHHSALLLYTGVYVRDTYNTTVLHTLVFVKLFYSVQSNA